MRPWEKVYLCKRCDRTTIGFKEFLLCSRCYFDIYGRYTREGELISSQEMDYIEEQDQLADFYLEEQNESHKREVSE